LLESATSDLNSTSWNGLTLPTLCWVCHKAKLPLTGSPDALTQHNGQGLDHSIVHVHLMFQTDKLVHRGRSAHHDLELGTLCRTNFPYLAKVVHLLHTLNQILLSAVFTIIGCKHGVYYVYFFFFKIINYALIYL